MECFHCGDKPCPVGVGYCHCGCGEQTPPTTSHHYPEGTHWKYQPGHSYSSGTKKQELQAKLEAYRTQGLCPYCGQDCEYGAGYCHCGCGKQAPLTAYTHIAQGRIKGLPSKLAPGHYRRKGEGSLTLAQVRQARFRYASQDVSISDLAREYNVSHPSMRRVLMFETYADAGIDTQMKEVG